MTKLSEAVAAALTAQQQAPPPFTPDPAIERDEQALATLKAVSPVDFAHRGDAAMKNRVLAYRARERKAAEASDDATAGRTEGTERAAR